MTVLSNSLALVFLLGIAPVVWAQADPVKDVAELEAKMAAAIVRGDVDAVLADWADNVVLVAARTGFRIEGKQAVREFLTNLYQHYPTRQGLPRHVTHRVYLDGNVVVVNGYLDQTFVDKNGKMSKQMHRYSLTWVKTGGRWLLVNVHNSAMPGVE